MLPALPAAFPDLTDTKLGTHPAPTTAVHLRVLPALPDLSDTKLGTHPAPTAVHLRVLPALPALPDLTDTKLGTHPVPTTAVHLPSAPDLTANQWEYYRALGVSPSNFLQLSMGQRAELANLFFGSPVFNARQPSTHTAPTPSSLPPTPTLQQCAATSSALLDSDLTPSIAASSSALCAASCPTSSPPPLRAVFQFRIPVRTSHETWAFIEESAAFGNLAKELPLLLPLAQFTRARADFDTEKLQGDLLTSLSANQVLWLSRLAACATTLSPAGRANLSFDEFFHCIVSDAALQSFQSRLEEIHAESGLTAQTVRKGFFSLQEAIRGVCGQSLSLIPQELVPLAKRAQSVISDLAARWSARAVSDLNETEVKKMTLVAASGAHERTKDCGVQLYLLGLCLNARLMAMLDGKRYKELSDAELQEATAIVYYLCIMGRPLSRAGVCLELEETHCCGKFSPSSESFIFLSKHKSAASVGALCLGIPAWLSGIMNLYMKMVRPALQHSSSRLWSKAAKCKLFPQEVTSWLSVLLSKYAGQNITASQIRKVFCLFVGGLERTHPQRKLLVAAAGHKASDKEDTSTTSRFYHSGEKAQCERQVMAFMDQEFYQPALNHYHNILLGDAPPTRPSLFELGVGCAATSESASPRSPARKKPRQSQSKLSSLALTPPDTSLPSLLCEDQQGAQEEEPEDEVWSFLPPLHSASLPALLFEDKRGGRGQEVVEDLTREQVAAAASAATRAQPSSSGPESLDVSSSPVASAASARKCRNSTRSHRCHSAGSQREFATDDQPNCDACVLANGRTGNAKRKRSGNMTSV